MGVEMKICFVCQGNIIRSPLAENIFRDLVQKGGLGSKYYLESSGTSAFHVGDPPDSRMRQVASQRGFEYTGQARQFQREDLDRFDLIIAMDKANLRYLSSRAQTREQGDKIRLMREYDHLTSADLDVPDPYYGGPEGFERTFDIILRSCRGLFEDLEGDKKS
jgi:protein-tyrosine phosphatase